MVSGQKVPNTNRRFEKQFGAMVLILRFQFLLDLGRFHGKLCYPIDDREHRLKSGEKSASKIPLFPELI